MSVIQSIQEKYAKLMAVIIALALILFVVMLAFENGGSLFRGSNSRDIGTVNGKTIEFDSFEKKKEAAKAQLEQQYGGSMPGLEEQAVNQAWSQEVAGVVLAGELDKLGMAIGKNELGDILYGANPPQDLKQQFTDSTGRYNAVMAKQQVDQMLKSASAEQKMQFSAYIEQLELYRLNEKYTSLLSNSINYPKWLVEKQIADNSQLANVSMVREFYTSIADSSVKITDADIADYISKHKKQFKQEETRGIAYVNFSALPTTNDTAAAKDKLLKLKPELDSTKNLKQFLETQANNKFYDGYINGKTIQVPMKDSIFAQPVGTTYGPYLDGGSFSLAKLTGIRQQPDTVTVRHILVGLTISDPQSGQSIPIRDSATAYKLADSIRNAIAQGSSFDTLLQKFSTDQGSIANGGKYEKVTAGRMVSEFNDFIFANPVGAKGIVKTEFGTHYIEILSTTGSSPAYRVAYLTQPIEASSETDAAAVNEANLFAGKARNQKEFDAAIATLKAEGKVKAFASDITPNASQIPGLGASRAFVRDIYAADLGDVLAPQRVGENYVVAIVTEVNEKGTQSTAKARLSVEPLLRNRKKAEAITQKIGTVTTLDAVAAKLGKTIEVADSIRMQNNTSPVLAGESAVIGAAFNPENKGKVVTTPIYGSNGVYVIRVDNVSATTVSATLAEQRQARTQQAKMSSMYPQAALMEAADIKDNRGKVY
ncbi:MAG: peptidylprolyl isomerase [Chitinophagaceae bacterium]|nr:MAG: peptidylprolyl isomerase [Chitinophagaceae bacterium]